MAETKDQNGSQSASAPGVAAFFRRWVCERHADKPWPHDDCPGPGMPPPADQQSRA